MCKWSAYQPGMKIAQERSYLLSICVKRAPLNTNTILGFNKLMEKPILVLNADEKECGELCALLSEQQYLATPTYSLPEMITLIQDMEIIAVIIDLDTVPIDNRTIRELTLKYSGVYFLCLSSDRFHPHLKEALCYHIYACINKPVDPDELFFWLKSICEEKKS
jgi:DNA-binding NtrC family response regulator